MRFVLSRRWALFALTIVLAAWGAWALGQWQFHRLQDKRSQNHVIAANLANLPVPVDQLLRPGQDPDPSIEWRRVTIHGEFDNAHSVVLKYQTSDAGAPGVDVITPLRTASGAAVLVDRGWLATQNSGNVRPNLPAAISGQVTITGFVRPNDSGGASDVADMSTRAISSTKIAKFVPYPLYGGYVDVATQSPPATDNLTATDLPDDTSDGPHFFYGIQWWFFGALAIFGFFYLMYDERKRIREEREGLRPPAPRPQRRVPQSQAQEQTQGQDQEQAQEQASSQAAQHASIDGQHRSGDE